MKFLFSTILCSLLISLQTFSQSTSPQHDILKRLGRGVNMGNSFEAPTETAWGNPWKPEYFKLMAEQGFNHVRLPIRWEPAERSMATVPYTITPAFLNRIKEVVDEARKNKLHIIINMHHHEALYETPDAQKERFLSQWSQIATFFKNYSDSLLFEVLNEPHGNLSADKWNTFFKDALTEIRKTNATRWVLLGTAEYGGLGAVSKLQLPVDNRIILSVHYYNPFPFTHQGAEWVEQSAPWLGTKWRDTQGERDVVINEFKEVLKFSVDNNIPLHVGEFGAYSTADMESRGKWTTFLARWFESQNLSWAYWEFSAGFGVYQPGSKLFIKPLIDALLHNPMPDPLVLPVTTIYASNFTADLDGWALGRQGGADGSLSRQAGNLIVAISNGGTENWHVQLTRTGLPLTKDKTYRISFDASATANRTATFYAGKATDPWNAYSSYNGISLITTLQSYTATFTMSSPTDLQSRLVIDLGKSTAGITLTNVKLEELKEVVTGIEENEWQISVYPNPVTSQLFLKNVQGYRQLFIYNVNGSIMDHQPIDEAEESVDISRYPNGIYMLQLDGGIQSKMIRLIKN